MTIAALSPDELEKINACWRACNYLAAGMIYLRDNPLLRAPLQPEHIKSRLLGHYNPRVWCFIGDRPCFPKIL